MKREQAPLSLHPWHDKGAKVNNAEFPENSHTLKDLLNTRISIILPKVQHTIRRRVGGWNKSVLILQRVDKKARCSLAEWAIIKNVFMFSPRHPLSIHSSFTIHPQHHRYNNPETWMLMNVCVWQKNCVVKCSLLFQRRLEEKWGRKEKIRYGKRAELKKINKRRGSKMKAWSDKTCKKKGGERVNGWLEKKKKKKKEEDAWVTHAWVKMLRRINPCQRNAKTTGKWAKRGLNRKRRARLIED